MGFSQLADSWWPHAVALAGTTASLFSVFPEGPLGITLAILLAASTAIGVFGAFTKGHRLWKHGRPQDFYQARPASSGDVPVVMRIAQRVYKTKVSDMDRTKGWLKTNRLTVHVVEQVRTYRDGRSVAEITGYHCTIPITEKVANRILSGQLRIVDLEPGDVSREGATPRAIYVGSVLGLCKGAGAAAMVSLSYTLEALAKGRPTTLLIGNPVTPEGLRLMQICGMQPHDKGRASELEVLHVGTLGDALAALRSRIARRRKSISPDADDGSA